MLFDFDEEPEDTRMGLSTAEERYRQPLVSGTTDRFDFSVSPDVSAVSFPARVAVGRASAEYDRLHLQHQ